MSRLPDQQLSSQASRPRFSVVVPLIESRGLAERCIELWTRRQTLPREAYEVIAVGDRTAPRLENAVARLLTPSDRLISLQGAPRTRLFDVGARAASGEFIFLTESHCLPEKDCLSRLEEFLRGQEYDGCCCRSVGDARSWRDRLDQQMFEEGFDVFSQEGDWRKVNVHGFAVRRRLYEDAGGLDERYQGFAEMMLAANLRDRGVRLGFAAAAVVQHRYRSTYAQTRWLIDHFVEGESRYRAENPGPDRVGYSFFSPSELTALPSANAGLWRALKISTAGNKALRLIHRQARMRCIGPALVGRRWDMLMAAWSRWIARLRCHWWMFCPARRARAYRDWADATARFSRISWLYNQPVIPNASPSANRDMNNIPEEDLLGFHLLEKHEGRCFRWTSAAAAIRCLLPKESKEITLEIGDFRHQSIDEMNLRLFWDGVPLAGTMMVPGRLSARLPNPVSGSHVLTILCHPLRPWETGVPDQRELGLPIFGISAAKHAHAAA
jgi:hypothetical protein